MSRNGKKKAEPRTGTRPPRSETVERVRKCVAELGGPSKASEEIGVSLRTLHSYLKGDSAPRADFFERLFELGFSADWLLHGDLPMRRQHVTATLLPVDGAALHAGDLVPIPFYVDARAGAGTGMIVEDGGTPHFIGFDEAWLRRSFGLSPRNLALMPASGNSMEPTIRSGEILLFDHSAAGRQLGDGIFVVRLEGTLVVKRLTPMPGHVVQVASDNQAHRAYPVSLDAGLDFEIIGRVVFVFRRL
jgi:phage repressor protein C with HTH and peptisase S24 domain